LRRSARLALSLGLSAPLAAWAQPAASPATSAGNTGLAVRPGLEVFAQYGVRSTAVAGAPTTWSHAFDAPRVHAAFQQRDDRLDGNQIHSALGTVGYRVIDPLEVFAAVGRTAPGAAAAAAETGSDQWEFRVVSRGVY
jgi:hypothetical protein